MKIKRHLRGFSLMEMMVAFVIALVAVLALVGVFPAGLTSIQQSADSVQTDGIAQEWMDYIREYYQTETRLPAGFPASGSSFDCTPGSLQASKLRGVTQTATTFTCTYTYVNVGVGGTPEHQIELNVSWTTAQRGTESRTYEEYVIN